MKNADNNTDRVMAGELVKSLRDFDTALQCSGASASLVRNIGLLARKAQADSEEGRLKEADAVLTAILLTLKRRLGTDISLRQGFVMSSILVEDIKRHITDPAVLYEEATDFAATFFDIYSHHQYRDPGLPDYLMQRPFPKGYKEAASRLIKLVESFHLPQAPYATLVADIRGIEKHVTVFAKGKRLPEDLYVHNVLLRTLCFDLQDLQGVYLSAYQARAVLGLLVFAVPAWLCAAPPAWIAQAILVLGGIIYGIYRLMRTPAARVAFKNMWQFIEDCTHSVEQATAKLAEEIKDLSDDEKKDLKEALEKALKEVQNDKALITGNRGKVAAKLRALIAAL
jgi:hypothetical protein